MSIELSEHIAGWDAVRDALGKIHAWQADYERFFDGVCDRLGAMSAELAGHQTQWAAEQQRNQWADELKCMRRLLEGISRTLIQQATANGEPAQSHNRPNAPDDVEQDGEDPVLDTVMAQFEMLQKDLTRRREVGV